MRAQLEHGSARSFSALLRVGVVTAVILAAGCSSTPRLAETPKAGVDLSGVWSSDVSRSDDVRSELRQALEHVHQKSHEVPDMPPDDLPVGGDMRGPQHRRAGDRLPPVPGWLLEEERSKREDLIAALVPASKVQIKQTDHGIVFSPLTGGAVRDLTPAERSTLFTSFATLRIVCGWQDNMFYVESRDSESGLRTVEQYTLSSDGKTLTETLQVETRHLKEQKYKVVYVRAD
jgi:hypothetical protein